MPPSSSYPYSRAEECSWQPEEVARQLSSLGGGNVSTDYSHLLMHRGWSSGQVAALRRMYGSNTMIDDEQEQPTSSSVIVRMFPCLPAILSALYGQLKEPLILMLLSSAGLSLFLGNTADFSSSPPLTQQTNIVFCGTLVRAGRGRALVVAVGEGTEFGKIHVELSTVASRKSPLQVKMDELGQRLAFGSMIAIAIIAVFGWLMGRSFWKQSRLQ